jgi:hypothetical protein
MNDKTEHTRFHIDRGFVYGTQGKKVVVFQWTRETLAGEHTLAAARKDLKRLKKESPSYFKDWRIVKRTVTEEVVE